MWGNSKKRTYLDWAAASPVSPRARAAFIRALSESGNPGALHAEALAAQSLLEEARTRIARLAEVKAGGVVFTSGATEANALAILGSVRARISAGTPPSKLHVLYHPGAHASVVGQVEILKEEGVAVEPLALAGSSVDLVRFRTQLRKETALVAIEAVSGETGERYDTLALRRELDSFAKKEGVRVLLHVDATQAPRALAYTLAHLGADMAALDAQKVGGVRGIGVLLMRSGVTLAPLMRGGGQEQGLRPGTENPALALAFAEALTECEEERAAFMLRSFAFRGKLLARLGVISQLVINEVDAKVPYIVNVSLLGRDTDYAVLLLDGEGFALSTKSACETNETGSRSVALMTGDEKRAASTLRISWGPSTTERELMRFADALIRTVRFLDEKAI